MINPRFIVYVTLTVSAFTVKTMRFRFPDHYPPNVFSFLHLPPYHQGAREVESRVIHRHHRELNGSRNWGFRMGAPFSP